ncbi:sigma-54 dependent transcriptional regulator [Shewanella sp. Isolate11]|uniref:sigma-54 dependent transcriptional regulator n=1 Tax=Shewanella sp. Isolate11 TaxID=2908530 RepID=UPI001EFE4F5F|nr:sigma-54 dependent transcriptional regulator [Shewanella sp. Isolate11]MCG9696937.1 sigma-54 dependent transcriptional regulator [Shewanella sp. Isolate11]
MSNGNVSDADKARYVLVLNLTGKECLTNAQDHHHWHFIHANSIACFEKKLNNQTCYVAIAIVDRLNQQSTIKAVKQLKTQFPFLLWMAISHDKECPLAQLKVRIADHFLDYHHLPIDWSRLNHTLGHLHGMAIQNQSYPAKALLDNKQPLIFGQSAIMQQLKSKLLKVANSDETVLLGGETGTGKDLCARFIHSLSTRCEGPFVTVNCGALPPGLIYSELFGHEKGAFTGADKLYIGHIERANNGTLFLDEIGDLSLELQINLLHFLEDHYIERLGSNKTTYVDCRIIFASHVDLENAVEEGHFREDLFYRINILQIRTPNLRQHKSDIPMLADTYLDKLSTVNQSLSFSHDAYLAMNEYQWPGNIRELKNRIQRAIIMADTGCITAEDLGLEHIESPTASKVIHLAKHRTEIDTELLLSAIKRNSHNISAAARELNISRSTFYRLVKKCKIKL